LALSLTDAGGTVTFTIITPAVLDPTDGIIIHVQFNDGLTNLASWSLYEPGLTSPVLFADTIDNDVDHSLEVEFTEDADWRNAISGITVDGTSLFETTDFETVAGKIILKPSGGNKALTSAGKKKIVVTAPGYENSEIVQTILAGKVSAAASGFIAR
jgi:hypothetical protein